MKEKIYEKATEYIETLASSLGVAAEHVYGILVRQQVAEGVTTLIMFGVIYLILGIILVVSAKKSDFTYDCLANYIAVIAVILMVFAAVIGLLTLGGAIMKVMNPEYYAIKEIMDVIKGATK